MPWTTPNLTDYLTFIRNTGITTTVLPDNNWAIAASYNIAIATVNPFIGGPESAI